MSQPEFWKPVPGAVLAELAPPCPRGGAQVPVHHPRLEHLKMYDWRLFGEAVVVNACGHRREYVLLPFDAARGQLVPILGEAS